MKLTLIVLFGTVGVLARWTIEEIIERRVLSHRPYATMAVNVLGALVAGFVVYASLNVWSVPVCHGAGACPYDIPYGNRSFTHWDPYLLTGFCGGFTTFSSAIAIPYLDWRHGQRWRATFLIGATPLICVVGYWIGELLTHAFY